LTAETLQIWRNCYESEGEESSRRWEQLQQNYESHSICEHVGQPTTYSLSEERSLRDGAYCFNTEWR